MRKKLIGLAIGAGLTASLLSSGVFAADKDLININVGGQNVNFKGKLVNEKTLVPLRDFCDNVGLEVGWDEQDKKLTISKEDDKIVLYIDNHKVTFNNHESFVLTAPQIIDDKTYVPLRFISENMGYSVKWDGDTRTAEIKRVKQNDIKIINKREKSETKNLVLDLQHPEIQDVENTEVQDKINKLFEDYVVQFKDENLTSALELAQDEYTKHIQSTIFSNYQIKYNQNDLLSVAIQDYTYFGGAHGMIYQSSYTIDLKTGKTLELKDLFNVNTDYIKIISDIVKKQLEQQDLLLTPFEEIKENQDYYIEDDNLVIYFQLYEYTPYAAGIPKFEIPLSDLNINLKENNETKEKIVHYKDFDIERIEVKNDQMHVCYPQIRNMDGELTMDYLNQDFENVIKKYMNNPELANDLELDYRVTYVGDDFVSIVFEGSHKYESGRFEVLSTLNYASDNKYYTVKAKNLIKHDEYSISKVNNLISKYSKVQGIEKAQNFGDWMGVYLTESEVVFYYLESDHVTKYTRVFIPKEEIRPFLNTEILPLDSSDMAS